MIASQLCPPLLLRLAATALVALTACSAPHRDASEPAYLALRNQYTQSLTDRYRTEGNRVLPAESLALRDLEQRLRLLIGPFAVNGLTDTGHINLATLLPGNVDSDLADGLLFRSPKQNTRTFVTTRGLFGAWLGSRFADNRAVPRDPLTALVRDEVYTPIFDDDAAVFRYADLPVTASRKRILAAMLIDRAQDYCFTCAPNTILLAVSAGNRIFVVDAPARDTIPIPPRCRDAADADTRPQQAIEAYRRTGNTDSSLSNRYTRAEDERFAAFRQCYGAAVRSDPRFERLVSQARALIEPLPDRE